MSIGKSINKTPLYLAFALVFFIVVVMIGSRFMSNQQATLDSTELPIIPSHPTKPVNGPVAMSAPLMQQVLPQRPGTTAPQPTHSAK